MGGSFGGVSEQKCGSFEISPLASMTSQEAKAYQEQRQGEYQQEEGSCMLCGIKSSKKKKESEVWRVDFEQQCTRMKGEFEWAQIIMKAGKQRRQTRVNCMKEYTDLKYEFEKKIQNREVPNSNEIRKILGKSALLESMVGQEPGLRESPKNSMVKASFQNVGKGKGRKTNPMVSTLNQNMQSLFLPKKIPKGTEFQIQSSIFLFAKFTELVQKHSQDPNNALCRIRLAFVEYMRQTYGGLTSVTRLEDQKLTRNIREFMGIYTQVVSVYYKISSISENDKVRFVFSYQNLMSAVAVILFKSEGFYRLVFGLYESSDKEFEKDLCQIMDSKKNSMPQAFSIGPEYCLNELTLNWYLSKSSFEAGLHNIEIPITTECEPFQTCTIKLRQIEEAQTPISKLKVIISTADKIAASINRFYQINSLPFQQMVDADQIMSIFIYILVHARVSNLKTHLRFVEHFCTEEQLMSETGYYSKVAQGALKILVQQGIEQQT